MRANSFLLNVLLMLAVAVFLSNCTGQTNEINVQEIVVTLDSENQLYVNGERMHFSKLQNLVETRTEDVQTSYILNVDAEACIYRINDITRTLHPAPVQFASAE